MIPSQPTRWLSLCALLGIGASALVFACTANPDAAVDGTDGVGCTDDDHDGFGAGCPSGQDCDDKNPAITTQCYACVSAHTGCGCSTEGARAECGRVVAETADGKMCGRGLMVCANQTWGECILNGAAFEVKTQSIQPMGLAGSATACPNPCDPYCRAWADTFDNTVVGGGDGGIIAADAGVTLYGTPSASPWDAGGDAMRPEVRDLLTDAGAMPEGGAYFYRELDPGTTSPPDDLVVSASIKYIDVYFLLDTSATMGPALSALGSAIKGAGGIIPTVRTSFPNARFGVGHFHAYQAAPHDTTAGPYPTIPWSTTASSSSKAVFPLWHSLNMQLNDVAAANVINWLGSGGTTANNDSTEGSNVAAFAAATSFGLWAQDSSGTNYGVGYDGLSNKPYWVNPRNATAPYAWVTDYPSSQPTLPAGTSTSGPCPRGTDFGFPCFDQQATPIVVLMTDNPGEQGPGGIFAQGHNVPASESAIATSTAPTPGASTWTAATTVSGNTTEATAVTIDPSRFARYTADLNGNPSAQKLLGTDCGTTQALCFDLTVRAGSFPSVVPSDTGFGTSACATATSTSGGGREAYFKFTVPAGLSGGGMWMHFDTFGSAKDLVLYVIDTATRKRVLCGDNYYNGTMTPTIASQQPHIDARLAAGNYILVVDEKASSTGTSRYFLNVNAMPDGWVGAPPAPPAVSYPTNGDLRWVTMPSFEQTVAAMNQVGAKFIGIDASGIGPVAPSGTAFDTCTANATNALESSRIDRWSYVSLQELARRTGSVDGTNANYWTNPFVFAVAGDGSKCRSSDATIATLTANAITQLAATVRQDVSVFARDVDDATDFDGAGGPITLTPTNLDEGPQPGLPHGVFIDRVLALPFSNGINGSADAFGGQPRCNGGVGDYNDPVSGATLSTNSVMRGCIPNTQVKFKVTFGVPASVPKRPVTQIFKFNVEVNEVSGSATLATQPAIIVIPPSGATTYPPYGEWERTFNGTGVCTFGQKLSWGLWSWNALTPSDSRIDFFVRTASSAAGLAAAPEHPLQFTNPPGPSGFVGTPIGAATATASGSALVDTTFALNGRPRGDNFVKVRAVLWRSTDATTVPALQSWNLQMDCRPNE